MAGHLRDGAVVSAVNWAETLTKLEDKGSAAVRAAYDFGNEMGNAFTVAPFSENDAGQTAALRNVTRAQGLSTGVGACLALALRESVRVVTADRVWAGVSLDVAVELIR